MLIGMAVLPLRHIQLTSGFGYRVHPLTGQYVFHEGIDLAARHDTVFAILSGRVQKEGHHVLLGVYIRLDHGLYQSTYGHLSRLFVLSGDSVKAGEPIAISGATGKVTGEHLHFSIQFKDHFINPLAFLYAIILKPTDHEQF
jgi:murein DD-endopeptidase MepM/ murein hydrolase activator NlpD